MARWIPGQYANGIGGRLDAIWRRRRWVDRRPPGRLQRLPSAAATARMYLRREADGPNTVAATEGRHYDRDTLARVGLRRMLPAAMNDEMSKVWKKINNWEALKWVAWIGGMGADLLSLSLKYIELGGALGHIHNAGLVVDTVGQLWILSKVHRSLGLSDVYVI